MTVKPSTRGVDDHKIESNPTTAVEDSTRALGSHDRLRRSLATIDRRVFVTLHAGILAAGGLLLLGLAERVVEWPGYLAIPWWVIALLFFVAEASSAAFAVKSDDGSFAIRIHRNKVSSDETVVITEPSRTEGPEVIIVDTGAGSASPEATSLIQALGGQRGLAIAIGDHTGGQGYILVTDRLGATDHFKADEVQLFGSLAATLGSRLSADRLLDQLENQARIDTLTGLANRSTIEAELDRRLGESGRRGAVLLLDLDRFKDVNDSLGHHFGDQLLQLVADRLQGHIRETDLAGRLGGDEYAIIVDVSEPGELDNQLSSLADRLTSPIDLDGITLEIGSSIGVARWPDDATKSPELLRLADIAMYEAKRTHRQWVQYDPTIDNASADRLALLGQIRDAIANRDLRIHLQPQVRTSDLQLVGAEALIRWHHPNRGLIPPNQFIPPAEQSSLAGTITHHVIGEAIEAIAELESAGHELTIWVNLTARDLLDHTLAPTVAAALLRSAIPPRCLGFEVTESALIVNLDTAIGTLAAIRQLGCRTAVDDFGTGYASLQYLQRLPVDEVKIDQSFVTDATANPDSAAIVRSTTRLIQDLGKEVVAEGIEDRSTLELLRQVGCDVVQGYYISRPLDIDSFTRWASDHRESVTTHSPR